MRGLALSTAVVALLFGALGQGNAEPIVYEGFRYGDQQRDLAGLEGGRGWGGRWDVVGTAPGGKPGPDPTNNWAHYEPNGLEFGQLVVARRDDPDRTPLGKARIRAGNDYVHVKGVRQLGLAAPHPPLPPTGYTIWGSYLWAPSLGVWDLVHNASQQVRSLWDNSMSALLMNNGPDDRDGWDTTADFFAAGDAWDTLMGGVGIKGRGQWNAGLNVYGPPPQTYLIVFEVSGLDTDQPSITEWIMNQDQFEHFKPYPDGWLTKEELENAGRGTEAGQVLQRGTLSWEDWLPYRVRLDYPLDGLLGLMSFDGGFAPIPMGADFDELRIANGDGDVALNTVTPIPEPSTFLLSVTVLLGLAAWRGGAGRGKIPPHAGVPECLARVASPGDRRDRDSVDPGV